MGEMAAFSGSTLGSVAVRKAASSVLVRSYRTDVLGIITKGFVAPDTVPVRSSSTPATVRSLPVSDVTGGSESGESWVHSSSHVNTPVAVSLEPFGLVTGQHRIPQVLIVAEHGVVVPKHTSDSTPDGGAG